MEQSLTDQLLKAALEDPKIAEPGFESSRVFALIHTLLSSPSSPRARLIKQLKTVYLFQIAHDTQEAREVEWLVDMKHKGRVLKLKEGVKRPMKPDVTIGVRDKDLVGLATGQLHATKLFEAKRIRVRGHLDRALNVEKILTQERQRIEAAGAFVPPSAAEKEGAEKGRWTAVSKKIKAKL